MVIEKFEIIKKLVDYEKSIEFKANSFDDVEFLLNEIHYNYPACFHVGTINYSYDKYKKVCLINPIYIYKKEDYKYLLNKAILKLQQIKTHVDAINHELGKELYIHDYLCRNVKYQDIGIDSHSMIGPLFYGLGVCEGISKTAQALFTICGIKSHIILGEALDENGDSEYHSWNLIKIHNEWRNLDITFDNTLSISCHIRYDYFNVPYESIEKDHIPDDIYKRGFYKCVSKNDYYKAMHLTFENKFDITKYVTECLINKKSYIHFKVDSNRLNYKSIHDIVMLCGSKQNIGFNVTDSYNSQMKIYVCDINYCNSLTRNSTMLHSKCNNKNHNKSEKKDLDDLEW